MNLEKLVSEFNGFGDGLLAEFRFYWRSSNNEEQFSFIVQAENRVKEVKEIHFFVNAVQQFKLTHDRNRLNYQVLSNGIHFVKIGELWSIEFGTFADPSQTLDEVMESDFYVTGNEIVFQIQT